MTTRSRYLLILLVPWISCSSNRKVSLIGEWKPVKVSYYNSIDKITFGVYNNGNNDSIKLFALKKYISQVNEDSTIIKPDTSEFKNDLEKKYLKYDSSKLILKKDSTFYMYSFGLIIPTVEPGWHFGDQLAGNWTQKENRFLELTIGDELINRPFFYKIIKHTADSLILGQTNEDYSDVYLKYEFVRL